MKTLGNLTHFTISSREMTLVQHPPKMREAAWMTFQLTIEMKINKKESLTHSLTVWWKFQGNFASLSTKSPQLLL